MPVLPAEPRSSLLLALSVSETCSREPWGWMSSDMSSACSSMSLHILSKEDAEMRWHLRSTCQVIGPYAEQMVLSREVPVVEPV